MGALRKAEQVRYRAPGVAARIRAAAGRKFAAVVACRRYWRHNLHTVRSLGKKAGGEWVVGIHFSYLGGQIRSLPSLISYLGSGEYRERYMGVKIPRTNLQPEHLEQARTFANELADTITVGSTR